MPRRPIRAGWAFHLRVHMLWTVRRRRRSATRKRLSYLSVDRPGERMIGSAPFNGEHRWWRMTQCRRSTIESTAVYSDCGNYRYSLTRSWAPESAKLLFLMHNPSKATEFLNDEIIMECQNFAYVCHQQIDFLPRIGSFRVCNLYPAFAPQKEYMKLIPSEILIENDQHIERACDWADYVICAWGQPQNERRSEDVKVIVKRNVSSTKILYFGLYASHPRHPITGVKMMPLSDLSIGVPHPPVPTSVKMIYRLSRWTDMR